MGEPLTRWWYEAALCGACLPSGAVDAGELDLVLVDRASGHADLGLLRDAFDEVLEPSFDRAELPGWAEFDAETAGPEGELVVVARAGSDIVGAGVTTRPVADDVTLLCYLAARPGLRSRGTGAALMGALTELWAAGGACLVAAEVHDPRVHEESEDEHPAARLRFYERCGGSVIGPWVQPALITGASRVHGMLLLSLFQSGTPIPDGILGRWTADYYAYCEGAVPDDAEYRELCRRLAEIDPSSPIPLARLGDVSLLDPR